jgi:hypothetical protein
MPIPVELMPLRMISLPGIDPWISFVHFLKYLGTKRVVANNELLGGKPAAVDVELKEDLGTLGLPVGEADAMEWRLSKRDLVTLDLIVGDAIAVERTLSEWRSRYHRSPCRETATVEWTLIELEILVP